MITSMDLIRAATEESEGESVNLAVTFEDLGLSWENTSENFQNRLSEAVVTDAMTEDVVSVAPETPVPEVAKILRENKIHRVLVIKKETLLGIISSFDLIRLLEQITEPEHPTPV